MIWVVIKENYSSSLNIITALFMTCFFPLRRWQRRSGGAGSGDGALLSLFN